MNSEKKNLIDAVSDLARRRELKASVTHPWLAASIAFLFAGTFGMVSTITEYSM